MSLAIAHFALGAMVGLGIGFAHGDSRYDALLMVLFGGFAMLPDVEKVLDHPTLVALHDSILANVFVLHQVLDLIDPNNSKIFAGFMVVALFLLTTIRAVSAS